MSQEKIRIAKAYDLEDIKQQIQQLSEALVVNGNYFVALLDKIKSTNYNFTDENMDGLFSYLNEMIIDLEDVRSFVKGKKSLENG